MIKHNLNKNIKLKILFCFLIINFHFELGIGDWGLGIGYWGLGAIPYSQNPNPPAPTP